MMANRMLPWLAILGVALGGPSPSLRAETVYVDSAQGSDANIGTAQEPVRSLARAAEIVNRRTDPGPTTIKIAPGAYCITETVIFENSRAYTADQRLRIEATILPDADSWTPAQMPVVISTVPGQGSDAEKHAQALRIEVSHATVQGLKFLGNPRPNTWSYAIFRTGKHLNDLVVTQCLFLGGDEALPYHCPVCANGQGLVIDHCIFYQCDIPVIFWDAEGGTSRDNAMRHCIVDGANFRRTGRGGMTPQINEWIETITPAMAESWGDLRQPYEKSNPEADWERFAAAVRALWQSETDLTEEDLKTIRCPVLISHGDRDSFVQLADIVWMYGQLGKADLYIAPAGKHGHHTDQIEAFGPILLRFLNRVHTKP